MHSKISLVNKEIGKIIFRSVGWISIIYFLGLFLVFPLEIIRSASEEQREYMWRENLFQFNFDFQFILSISIPVLMAIFLFRFLQVKSYSDLIHSLPVKRESVFHQYTIIGLVLLITPILANALIIIAFYKPLNLADFFTVGDIFQWLMTTILFNILIFFAGVFVGMLCGISAAQGVLTYIALLLPSGMLVLLIYNLPYYLYGFPEQYFMQRKVEVFSPLVRFYFIAERPLGLVEIIVYVLLLIALYGLSLFLYKNRKLEAVSQALVFPVLKPFFKYGTTFCTMLLGGMYFGQMERNTAWVIVGYLFGAVIGYFIAEMVLQKSWRIIIHIKGLLVYSGIIVVLAFLFQVDFTYYEKTVPPLNEIERVHLSSNYYYYKDKENTFFLKEVENIELISRLQKEIIANKNRNKRSLNNDHAFFVYELKNGKKIVRNYLIDKNDYAHFYKFIHESDEFKQTTNPVLQVKADQIEKMTIRPNGPIYKKTVIIDPNDLQEAVSILQEEVYSATYEDTQDERDSYSNIVIVQKNKKNISLDWRVSYKKFENWLAEKSLLDDARINAEDISYAYIAKREDLDLDYSKGYENVFEQMEKNGTSIKITDKAKLKTCFENATSHLDGPYIIGFYYKVDGSVDIKSFNSNHVRVFVEQGL